MAGYMKQSGTLVISSLPRKGDDLAYQANAPMSETNLSSSLELAQERREQKMTVPARKRFFCHFTFRLFLPDRTNRPFSMIRTAGKSCSGMERRIAIESIDQQKASTRNRKTYKGTERLERICPPGVG